MIDAKELLVKYMARVIDAESISYIDHGPYANLPVLQLSKEELEILNATETEARRRLNSEERQ